MTEEQKIKRAKGLYGNLVYPKIHIELYIDGYLAGAKELENQIADIKANCDLAIEGRDIKIKELEQKNKELEKRLVFARAEFQRQYKENADLKETIADIEKNFRICESNADTNYDQLTKAKDLIKNIKRVTWEEGWNYSLDWKVKAEQFLKEIEK